VKAISTKHVLRSALAGGVLALALGSCGKVGEEGKLQIDSNTNWLMRCGSDNECSGSLRCYCGQCSQPCSESNECGLLAGAECAASGGAVCTNEPSVGGLCVLGCSEDADCGPDFTCTERQCVPKPCTGGYQSWDEVLAMVAADTNTLDTDDATFTRYVSLANRWSYGACGRTLTAERQGLSKLLNSLSRSTVITTPTPVDADETLYRINLRDYEWDQTILIANTFYRDAWEAIATNNPFAVPFAGEDADDAVASTDTSIPLMFANSFIATATRPDIYYAILGTEDTYDAQVADLGVDPTLPGVRAGFDGIIAVRRPLGNYAGYLWDLGSVDGGQASVLRDPLQAPDGEHQLLFSLPNGLQAFAYTGASGQRLNDSDTLLDTNQNNFRATVPLTPFRQHSPRPSINDAVRDNLDRSDPGLYPLTIENAIVAAYPGREAITTQIDLDYETYTRPALEAALVNPLLPEPIAVAFAEYDRDMVIEDVAGELMITKEQLERNMALLDPAFSVLEENGFMDRDDFALLFREALCTMSVVNENVPDPILCL
jgi:hypothetical protein